MSNLNLVIEIQLGFAALALNLILESDPDYVLGEATSIIIVAISTFLMDRPNEIVNPFFIVYIVLDTLRAYFLAKGAASMRKLVATLEVIVLLYILYLSQDKVIMCVMMIVPIAWVIYETLRPPVPMRNAKRDNRLPHVETNDQESIQS